MGGAISFAIALSATALFAIAGSPVLAFVSGATAVASCFSWAYMWYFARNLARQRLFVAALDRGEFDANSSEAEAYWNGMQIDVAPQDIADVPDWISMVNMVATGIAVILLIWAVIDLLV